MSRPALVTCLILLAFWPGSKAAAWTQESLHVIADQAARLAPPDLYRQLVRHRASYRIGVDEAWRLDQAQRFKDERGGGKLDVAISQSVEFAIQAIRAPRPFNEICFRLGLVVHYVGMANFPLATSASDPQESRYASDFARYGEVALPRIRMLFYGFHPQFDGRRDLPALISEAFGRGRRTYPLVGREYRRVGFASGTSAFDDRSTAYAITALAFNHAISDSAEVLRYIWLAAGGVDRRPSLPLRGQQLVPLSPLSWPSTLR